MRYITTIPAASCMLEKYPAAEIYALAAIGTPIGIVLTSPEIGLSVIAVMVAAVTTLIAYQAPVWLRASP